MHTIAIIVSTVYRQKVHSGDISVGYSNVFNDEQVCNSTANLVQRVKCWFVFSKHLSGMAKRKAD